MLVPHPSVVYSTCYGAKAAMESGEKIRVDVRAEPLAKAQEPRDDDVTATLREGLRTVSPCNAYRRLRDLRGKVVFSIDLERLREDGA